MIRALADAKVDFTQSNSDGLTALDVAEGKQPAAAAADVRGVARHPPAADAVAEGAVERRRRWPSCSAN